MHAQGHAVSDRARILTQLLLSHYTVSLPRHIPVSISLLVYTVRKYHRLHYELCLVRKME